MFQYAFLWQVNKPNMRLGLLCLVITVVCLFHINEGKLVFLWSCTMERLGSPSKDFGNPDLEGNMG